MSEPVSEHLTVAEVAAYVDGVAAREVRARIDTHIGECDDCRDEIVDASRIAAIKPRTRRSKAAVWIPVAIAAALVCVLVRPASLRNRGVEHREAALTTTVLPRAIAPLGAVDSLATLQWTSVPNADRYQVQLLKADGTVVWDQATSDTTVDVPASIGVQPRTSYYWTVRAQTGFDRWAVSDPIAFSVRYPRRR